MNIDDMLMFEGYLKNKACIINEFGPPEPGSPTETIHKQTFKDVYESQIRQIENAIKDLSDIVVKLQNIGITGEVINTLKIQKDNIIKTKQKMILDLKHKILDHGGRETGEVTRSRIYY